MFLIQRPDFSIREFSSSDFEKLYKIADAINRQAKEKEGFQPFYAFQVNPSKCDYGYLLDEKINNFLKKAEDEKKQTPRKTYRLALCDSEGQLVGNITIDDYPTKDKNGNLIQGDVGYFINPLDGRKGLMSKALACVLDVYFKTHDELDITVHPNNLYSIKMLQRFNAKVVGFKSMSSYQNEPRMVLKIFKSDFLASKMPRCVVSQKKQIYPQEMGRIRYV